MSVMFRDMFADFNFGSGPPPSPGAREASLNRMTQRQSRLNELIAPFELENRLYRKPCPTCQTLVKPELQLQHNDAYHPDNKDIPHTPETDHD